MLFPSILGLAPAGLAVLAAAGLSSWGCSGASDQTPADGPPGPSHSLPPGTGEVPSLDELEPRGATDIARLSHSELASSMQQILGVDVRERLSLLPPDSFTPFDNATTLQSPSTALVEGLNELAEYAASKALESEEGKARIVGCVPTSATDAECFGQFLRRMGRKILHRPLSESEVSELSGLLGASGTPADFYVAAKLGLQVLLQDMEFVYRVEVGQPTEVKNVVRLTPWELGAKLSYMFWGQTPDDALLDAAERGELSSAEQVRAQVTRLLAAPQATARLTRFHGLWLGYDALPESELNRALRTESDALVQRVVMEQRAPWPSLLTANETYIDAQLAEVYGMTPPEQGFAWVAYPDGARAGLLSHGALLSNGAKQGETSPTLRGQFILERLLCSPAPPPPPTVSSDEPPKDVEGKNCKADRYVAHRENPTCAGCHALMDPIGMGLESYDIHGRFRMHDPGKPECVIDGAGELPGVGAFRGPAELGRLIAESDKTKHCLAEHLYQYVSQRLIEPADDAPLQALQTTLGAANFSLVDALSVWASNEAFRYRFIRSGEGQ